MKLLIYEHITSGALLNGELPASLAHEGDMILQAIVQDLQSLGQTTLSVLRDHRLPALPFANIDVLTSTTPQHYQWHWQQQLQAADAFLVIAPETAAELSKLQAQITAAGKYFLGCDAAAINLCSDKYRCAQHLQAAAIATPSSQLATDWQATALDQAWLLKPNDGAGCLDTWVFDNSAQLQAYLQRITAQQRQHSLVQPFCAGQPASLSLYIEQQQIYLLSKNLQNIQRQGQQLLFTGCEVNAVPADCLSDAQALELCRQLLTAIPGLQGFVGVDLLLDGTTSLVIEINPRLTTAYAGIAAATGQNPARFLKSALERLQG